MSQEKRAVSPSDRTRDWGLVRILAARVDFTAADDFTLASDKLCFSVRDNFSEEAE